MTEQNIFAYTKVGPFTEFVSINKLMDGSGAFEVLVRSTPDEHSRLSRVTIPPAEAIKAAQALLDAIYGRFPDSPRLQPPAPTSERVQALETGWLIELISRLGLPPTWFALGGDDGEGAFTADSTKALRFARKQDAQAYIDDIGWTECIPTEHEWSDPSPKAAPRIAALKATP